jgi:hypothetical protein
MPGVALELNLTRPDHFHRSDRCVSPACFNGPILSYQRLLWLHVGAKEGTVTDTLATA